MHPRHFRRGLLVLVLSIVAPGAAFAQTGAIAGRVTDTTATGVPGATVTALAGTTNAGTVISGGDGRYRLVNLAPGTYTVVVTRIGHLEARSENVRVEADQTTTMDVQIRPFGVVLNPTVVTASRTGESYVRAPASIHPVTSDEIERHPAVTPTATLHTVPGVHPTDGGIAQTNISTRGFNNAFSGALLMLQDYRFAGVPSLRVNVPLLLTGVSEDIDRMEVLLGPASALYGPNSANGVLHVITKSPFASRGTTLTVDAGERSILSGAIRHASALSPRFGFKVSGEYLTGKDWEFDDPAEPATYPAAAPAGREGETARRDFDVTKMAGEARIDFRPTPTLDLITTYGYSKIDNALELTGTNGTAQARNWTYQSIQQRINWGRLFVQGFVNLSDAGNKDATDLRGTFLLRNGVPIVDNSRVFAVQAQHGADLFDGRESLVYGVDYIFTNPRTGGTINGRNEENDDVREVGAYLQSTTHLSRRFDLIGALRVDNHDLLDETFFSPRVALMFMPSETQSLRATYNRAFSTPSNFSFFLDLPQAFIPITPTVGYQVRGLGVPTSGFTFRRDCTTGAGGLCMRSPFPVVGPTGAIATAPNTVVDANAAQYYRTLVGGNQTAFVNALLAAGVTPANVGTVFQALFGANTAPITTRLRVLRPPRAPGDNPFPIELQGDEVLDLEPLKATTTDAFEIGYKGVLGGWGRLAVDVWYQKRKNFTTPAQNVTPNSFMDPATLGGVIAGVLTAQAGAGRVPAAA